MQHSSVACLQLSILNNSSRQRRLCFEYALKNSFCVHILSAFVHGGVRVCAHVSNWGAETKEVSGWISPPHLWVPRELLDAPQVLLNRTWMPHHHHLRSRDTLTRLLEEDKACSINNSRRKALLIYLMWLNATEWADGVPTCQPRRLNEPSLGLAEGRVTGRI